MAETTDYDPGPWRGHDFKSARVAYDRHAGRSYNEAVTAGKKAADLVPEGIKTNSEAPLVIACDVTGSMGEWPATIFSKLPYLELEGKEYLGETMEISFAAIGDAVKNDKYPLQVRPFVNGTKLADEIKALVVEGGGGGGGQESYDLAAEYYAENVDMPNAIRKPIFIFIGDEGLYENLDPTIAESFAKVEIKQMLKLEDIFGELTKKYNVYVVRKSYGAGDASIQAQWAALIGEEHICPLDDANRVVDVIFGILARETGRIDYFKKELKDRQKPAQVDVVMKSLKTVHALGGPKNSVKKIGMNKSVTRRKKGDDDDAKPTKSLI
jgi:hypothetical protein